jgi:sensor c-di-GMP phosphodiesterase-like protein
MDLVAHDIFGLVRRYPDFRISFNFSSTDLQSPEIVPALQEFLRRTSVDSANIVIEATERGFLSPELTSQVIRDIRALGVQVAIDDFGTGYSSLSYLTTLEVDYLKIDKIFVEAVDTDAATSQVALHIIEMAKSLNLAITAEGIETPAQAEFLRRHGVSFGQGWLFGKPMSIGELERRLETLEGFPEATERPI